MDLNPQNPEVSADPPTMDENPPEDQTPEPEPIALEEFSAHRFSGTDHSANCISCGFPFDHPIHQTL